MKRTDMFTKNLVKEYAELMVEKEFGTGENDKEKELREAYKEKLEPQLYEQIRSDIYNLEKLKIIEDGKKELDNIEKNKKIHQLKFILIEGIILGLITGLLVNQITDIISYTKGNNNYTATAFIISILTLLGILFAFVVYLNKIEEYLIHREEK